MVSITSADVAREAGVSRATVSYVLNDTPGQSIPEPTRQRVIQAAERLGYAPHAGARSLRLGRSDAVLFPLRDVTLTHVFGHAINACSAALNRHGFTLVTDATRYETPDAAVSAWRRLDPAAFIDLTMPADDPALMRLVAAGIPRVAADIEVPEGLAPISVVSLEARRLQLAHVAERGARRVVYAAPPELVSGRLWPLLSARMQAAASDLGVEWVVDSVEQTHAGVVAAVDRWLASADAPDAVCGDSDDLALPILSALIARGVDVPGRMLVIGVDDVPASQAMSPALSSVDLEVERFGAALAIGVRSAIDAPKSPVPYAAPEFLVMSRESTNRRA